MSSKQSMATIMKNVHMYNIQDKFLHKVRYRTLHVHFFSSTHSTPVQTHDYTVLTCIQ